MKTSSVLLLLGVFTLLVAGGAGSDAPGCGENQFLADDECVDCGCNDMGSASLQCDDAGVCTCKAGVTGAKCDSSPTYFRAGKRRYDYIKMAKKELEEMVPKEKIDELKEDLRIIEALEKEINDRK